MFLNNQFCSFLKRKNHRFGLVRSRQFLMNDLYSFDLDEKRARESYELVSGTYDRILRKRLGLNVIKVSLSKNKKVPL